MATSHPGFELRHSRNRAHLRPISSKSPGAAGRGPVAPLTVVRTMGVGAPSLRAVSAASPTTAKVDDAVATALCSLDVLRQHTGLIATAFDAGRVLEGQRGLIHLVRGTQTLVRLAVAAAKAGGDDLLTVCSREGRVADEATRRAVDRLVTCQLGQDWSALADTLRAEFAPALALWGQVFHALGRVPSGSGPDSHAA